MSMTNPKSVHAGHRKRIRRRFQQSGMEDFAPHESLELALSFVIPRVDVNRTAHALLNRFGSVSAVLDATEEELCDVEGVGPQTALYLRMLPSLFRLYAMDKCTPNETYDTVAKLGKYLHALYVGVTVERVYILLFNNGMGLMECCHLGDGTVNSSPVTVRRIAELALTKKASCVVLAHNHPRGLAIPSASDLEVTRNVDTALEIIGVPLLEHIIVTENNHAPILRNQKGLLRCDPATGGLNEGFYRRFYGEGE